MNLKTILARFESALGYQNLTEKMVLLPEPKAPISKKSKLTKTTKGINFIVGYNSSPQSQTALDITMWMAHQTRLVTTKEVTVQVVYVLDESPSSDHEDTCSLGVETPRAIGQKPSDLEEISALKCAAPAIALPAAEIQSVSQRETWIDPPYFRAIFCGNNEYEVADKLLWQARCLAEEWRGLFKAHLRIGRVATELRNVVELESANLLFLGCNSANHPLVKQLGKKFPCCVLGIPEQLSYPRDLAPEESLSKLQFATAMPAR
ncbi:universal stress protein [Microcoleus sp. bin38.metabat.b11b12b14.051]|uniref:universal stress protein n=1 Tax=Microcoleus sp. bin38.metabat.b11b12b14.051 TaxID=2742709 RepID=UPI0025DF3408|nr:universal stress protein [Microcoleus sp. bin38.metabat.b11b12b14.051]